MTEQILLQPGDVVESDVLRLNDDGEGVGSADGLTLFLPDALPGERVHATVTELGHRFARGIVLDRVTDAPQRVTPACGVFGACGGCQLQHAAYDTQLKHKHDVVQNALQRMAKLPDVPVRPTLGMETPWRYRNQVQVPLAYDAPSGTLTPGFFAARSHHRVPTDTCHLEPLDMERTIQAATRILADTLGTAAVHVHHLIARRSHTNGQQLLILSVDTANPKLLDLDRAAHALLALPNVVGVARTVQPRSNGPVWGSTTDIVAGLESLTEDILGLEFIISPRSFFQVNTVQARALYERVLHYAQAGPEDTVVDAYCGTGTIGLLLARQAKAVVGIENIAPAVRDAKRNARHNGIDNIDFVIGDVEHALPKMAGKGRRFDIVVLDPPRKGCHWAVLDAIADMQPTRVVYVSCNHATWARDVRMLTDRGYTLVEALPVDMFPQTSHVEVVSVLVRGTDHPQ